MTTKKRLLRPYEKILFFLAVALIAWILSQQYGCPFTKVVEETAFTDGSSHDQLKPQKRTRPQDASSDETVRQLANLFADHPEKSNNALNRDINWKRLDLSADERSFYKDVRKKYVEKEKTPSVDNWFSILRAAGSTYSHLQDIFAETTPEKGDDFYAELERRFGIPRIVSKNFAAQGKQKVSDWAVFVEENK